MSQGSVRAEVPRGVRTGFVCFYTCANTSNGVDTLDRCSRGALLCVVYYDPWDKVSSVKGSGSLGWYIALR